MAKFKKQSQYNYYIYDDVGFPIGSIYNKNFKIHLVLDVAISYDKLIELLNEIERLRESHKIDVSYGDYILGK